MKQVFKAQCAVAACVLIFGAFSYVRGQAPSATPDPFVVQLTSSTAGFQSFAGDISLDGRFVVVESNGDISTEKTPARNNADGNREIFLIDYAQRRIFQITNTRNVPRPSASPTPTPTATPSPVPSPTPTPLPTPAQADQIKYEISGNRPMISFAPPLTGAAPGTRTYTIVFSSNSPSLPDFAGTDLPGFVGTVTSPASEGNQELWIYRFTVTEVADLSSGAEVPFENLAGGTFTRLTDTVCSVPTGLRPSVNPVHVIDDNREATISDNGNTIAFVSTANLVGTGNTDRNPELFFWTAAGGFVQGTTTQDAVLGLGKIFQQNPSISADGTKVAFMSSANLATPKVNSDGNLEIYLATTSAGLSDVRQVTKTKTGELARTTNRMPFGRRLSRDARFIAFESLLDAPDSDAAATEIFLARFVYDGADQTIKKVGQRSTANPGDILSEPTFTDYNGTLTPGTLLFSSAQNFKADGTFPATDQASTGLNPQNQPQIFATQLPVASTNTFVRLTKNPVGSFGGIKPLGSNSIRRIAFSLGGTELGGGNADFSTEVYYLLTPPVTPPESTAPLSFFAWPSTFPVATATPAPSPAPSPGTIALGLAAGEFSMIRSTVGLANSDPPQVTSASEAARSPILPAELAGVSVSVNGAAAGLYFVGNTAKQIDFVMPPGLAAGLGTVVVNNNGTVFRGFVQIVPSQPDIFTSTHDAGGRAVVCNVTNTAVSGCVGEPFKVTSLDSTGATVATILEVHLTGVRGILPGETKVTIGTTEITPTSVRRNTNNYGYDIITFTLPATLVAGDYPIIVTVTKAGTFSSRGAATAPRVQIIAP